MPCGKKTEVSRLSTAASGVPETIPCETRILAMERPPDGLFAANDVSAVAVMVELKARGIKVPGDIAVVGFNNVQISRAVEPPLTTIHYPSVEMGRLAATSLLGMLDGDNELAAHHVVLRHELIVGLLLE
jgi:LacI family transcriptional regulator